MPYTKLEDLPDAVKELSEDLQKQWMAVFNNAFDRCMEKQGEKDKCEGSAAAQAWSVVNENRAEDGFVIQTLIFPKDKWDSLDRCREWAKEHDYKIGDVRETDASWRLAQRDENDFLRFRLICVNPGIDTSPEDCKVKAEGGPLKSGRSMEIDQPQFCIMGIDGLERRCLKGAEIRLTEEAMPKITGYAAVFNKPAMIMDWFKETVRKGAFARTIQNADIVALLNHDRNYVLGRNKAGTLHLEEDDRGLRFQADPPDTQWARDLLISMRRGDISGGSFNFKPVKGGEEWTADNKERTLTEVKLFDVSVVTQPAYLQASVQVRSILTGCGIDFDSMAAAMFRLRHGIITEEDKETLRSSSDTLRGMVPAAIKPETTPDPAQSHSEGQDSDPAQSHSQEAYRDFQLLKMRLRQFEAETGDTR